MPAIRTPYGGLLNQNKGGYRDGHLPDHATLATAVKVGLRTRVAVNDFQEMMLPQPIRGALAELGVTVPAPVQQLAMPALLERKSAVVAAPSGAGKTIAALAPIYAKMVDDRDVYKVPLRERRPRCVVLAPTRELAEQLRCVCMKLDEATGLSSLCIASPGVDRKKHRVSKLLKERMPDVVVVHPHQAMRLIEHKRLFIEDLRYVVMDEADALTSSGHGHSGLQLLTMVRNRCAYKHLWPVDTQRVFLTSTMTMGLQTHLLSRYPGITHCVLPRTHRVPFKASVRFYKVTEEEKLDHLRFLLNRGGNRPGELPADEPEHATAEEWPDLPAPTPRWVRARVDGPAAAASAGSALVPVEDDAAHDSRDSAHAPVKCVWENVSAVSAPFTSYIPRVVFQPGERVMVFFKNIDRATALYHKLHELGYKVVLVHAMLPDEIRRRNFARWMSGQCNVILTTDLLSRGIDVRVDRVINFDMPVDAPTFLARAGRTARMGRRGTVSSLFVKNERVIVDVIRGFVRGDIALNAVGNEFSMIKFPTHEAYRKQKRESIARRYVELITRNAIPQHKERKLLTRVAKYRALWRPWNIAVSGGVNPRLIAKTEDRVGNIAVWARREQMAKRMGGSAKFGKMLKIARSGPHSQRFGPATGGGLYDNIRPPTGGAGVGRGAEAPRRRS